MKKILILLVLAFSISAMAQEKEIVCDSVIQAQGKTVKEIYPLIKMWVSENFKSAKSVIQMDDPENGILICKGNFNYRGPGGATYRAIDGRVEFTLKVQVRDGRFRVTVSDFTHYSEDLRWSDMWHMGLITDREKYKMSGMQDSRWKKTWPDLQTRCKVEGYSMIIMIQNALSKSASTDNDW